MISYRTADILKHVKRDFDGVLRIDYNTSAINFVFHNVPHDPMVKIKMKLESAFQLQLQLVHVSLDKNSWAYSHKWTGMTSGEIASKVVDITMFLGERSSITDRKTTGFTTYKIDNRFMDEL